MDILWPRWVARIGVTRSTQAWFLAADRQCVYSQYVCMGGRKTGGVTVTQERHTEPQDMSKQINRADISWRDGGRTNPRDSAHPELFFFFCSVPYPVSCERVLL